MTPSFRKKLITILHTSQQTDQFVTLLDALIVVMKKFGKQMSQWWVSSFLQEHYPEVYELYMMLGGNRLSVKDCLLLKQKLYESQWEQILHLQTTHTIDVDMLQDGIITHISWDNTNPSLTISSPSKLYKRSLMWDLQKLL